MIQTKSVDASPSGYATPSALRTVIRKLGPLFFAFVLAPTLAAIAYFGFLASDVYISESKFVIRSPDRPSTSAIGLLLQGAGFSRAQDDAYAVQDYILSRDAINGLEASLQIKGLYAASHIDIASRFSGFDSDDSLESFHKYYQKVVSVQHDATSSISTLRVRAFTSEDAKNINSRLLELSESLVNRINERGRQDLIKSATTEVDEARARTKSAAVALTNFRSSRSVVDPERQATLQLQQITKLQDELLASKLQLNQLRTQTPDNSQIRPLQSRIKLLEAEVEKESEKITGSDRSLTSKSSDYQRLVLDREFAERQLASAMTSLESARNEARRKQVYLERIVQPNIPDYALEPKRLQNILATLALGSILWGIFSMLTAGVKEHQL